MGLWLLPSVAAIIVLLLATRPTAKPVQIRLWAEIATGLIVAGLPFLCVMATSWPVTCALIILQLWLVILPLRLLFGRLDWAFLRGSTLFNAVLWAGLVFVSLLTQYISAVIAFSELWMILAITVSLGFIAQLVWTLKHYRLRKLKKPVELAQLPTVSVCIPARNEDTVLLECLQSVLASDYPKLEIIVLDDCSQDKTAGIVRQFAHDGVRFIQGELPASGWLGKNQAMQTLAEHASGDYMVCIGVDVRLQPHSISRLVHYTLSAQAQMVSVLPQNTHGLDKSTLLSPLQYFWQVVLPISARRVPVSSKAWIINTDVLKSLGGFASVKHKVVPEGSFALRLASSNSYRFLLSNDQLGLTEQKKWSSQVETSIRLLYPTCKRQPFYVVMALAVTCGLLLAPFIVAITLVVSSQQTLVFWLSIVAAILLWVSYGLVRFRTHPSTWPLATLLFPFSLMQECVLFVVSMLQYEFGDVNWKGRNVCYPVIATQPSGVSFVPAGAQSPVRKSSRG